MLILTLNAVFAGIFLSFAWGAFKRALPFLKTGWQVISVEAQKPGFRQNIESRRIIAQGGRFLIGGVFWFGAGVTAVGLGLYFLVQIINLYRLS